MMSWHNAADRHQYRTNDRYQLKPQQFEHHYQQRPTDKRGDDIERRHLGPLESGAGLAILETKFTTNIASDNTRMDDMIFHCNNKNAIYVLNANYASFGDSVQQKFPGHPRRSFPDNRDKPSTEFCSTSTAKVQPTNVENGANPTTIRNVNKFKVFGNLKSSGGGGGGGGGGCSGNDIGQYSNYANKSHSQTATAIQKLFSCSSAAGSNASGDIQNNQIFFNRNNNNNNNNSRMTERNRFMNLSSSGIIGRGDCSGRGKSGDGGGGCNKKQKTTAVKSTLIAKKTKFLKYLEEEKWHSSEWKSSADNQEPNSGPRVNNSSQSSSAMLTMRNKTNKTQTPSTHTVNKNNNQKSETMINGGGDDANKTKSIHRKLMNWSGTSTNSNDDDDDDDDDGNNSRFLQLKEQNKQKSSAELYKEAAELLGLSCMLCDNCRCLDCQSRYFDWDDSDSLSEISLKEGGGVDDANDDDDDDGDDVNDDDDDENYFADVMPKELHRKHSYQSVLDFENYSDSVKSNGTDHNFRCEKRDNCCGNVGDIYPITIPTMENIPTLNGLSLKEKSE